jgi:nucleoside-diphosphate-sugar epimerase
MNRVLVTGASGFIGRNVLAPLVAHGFDVHAVSRRPLLSLESPAAVCWHAHDLLDPVATRLLVERIQPSHLLHLAWYAEPGKYWSSPLNLDWVAASLQLLRAFHEFGGRRATFAGTCAEYAWGGDGLLNEATSPLEPASLYGASKKALHQLTASFAATAGLSTAWGRVFLLYGPHEHPARLVASVARALIRGEPAETSTGDQRRDFLHSEDVASAFVSILLSEATGAVNIGSGVAVPVRRVVELLGDVSGRSDLLRIGARAAAPGDPALIVADVSRLHGEIGWRPAVALEEGLRMTLQWWREQDGVGADAHELR